MKFRAALAIAALALLTLVACDAGKKATADAALKAADTASSSVIAEGMKYVPDQAKALQDSISNAHAAYDKGDYGAVITAVKDVPSQAKALSDAIKAKKDELTAKFNEINAKVPGLMEAINGKMAQLQKMHKVPAGADTSIADLKSTWGAATSAFSSGDIADAAAKASAAQQKLDEIRTMLGMKS